MILAIQAAKEQIYQIKRYRTNHSKVDIIFILKYLVKSARIGKILIEILLIIITRNFNVKVGAGFRV